MIKYTSQALRAIAQLVEHLVYTRANVFQGSPSYNQKNGSYWEIDVLLHNFKRTTAWQTAVRSDLSAHLGTKQTPSLIWDIDKVNTSTFNARHNEYKALKKSLFVLWTWRCMKFHIGFLTIETSFNLKRSRPEADLRQDNPTLETLW